MIIEPKIRGFICTTAHPAGCEQSVAQQINYVKSQGTYSGPKNVLVIGASTGFGLASRIAAAWGFGAKTIGVFFEKPADSKRTATAGWYNTAAFEKFAHQDGLYAKSINGDAFSNDIKQQTADLIREDLGQIDLVVYSLASPRRIHPNTGEVFNSTLKPIGKTFTSKTVDPFRDEVKEITIEPASQEEIQNTVEVMGGEDWRMWIDFLAKENLLAPNFKTVAYTYIGPELTHDIYKEGTIGRAKDDLHNTATQLNAQYQGQGEAIISVNKALVTQASAAIPVVPLYISILFKIMKQQGTHEGCIEQIQRLFKKEMYAAQPSKRDAEGRIRIDDLEMDQTVQEMVEELWPQINSENLNELTDIQGYRDDFYRLFGFKLEGVDYAADVNPEVNIASIKEQKDTMAV